MKILYQYQLIIANLFAVVTPDKAAGKCIL